jgi:hypothetical protein
MLGQINRMIAQPFSCLNRHLRFKIKKRLNKYINGFCHSTSQKILGQDINRENSAEIPPCLASTLLAIRKSKDPSKIKLYSQRTNGMNQKKNLSSRSVQKKSPLETKKKNLRSIHITSTKKAQIKRNCLAYYISVTYKNRSLTLERTR